MMIAKTFLATAALAAGSVLIAPAAHADEKGYIRDLRNNGWVISNPVNVLRVGYAICDQLNHNNGEEVAEVLYTNTPTSVTPTPDDARLWVLIAVAELCPWHYHGTGGGQVT
jgi:hypothetical protein